MAKKAAKTEDTVSKQSNTKAEKKTKAPAFKWTAKLKKAAHTTLVNEWNSKEVNHRASLNLDFLPDGTAVSLTIGRAKNKYSVKMS